MKLIRYSIGLLFTLLMPYQVLMGQDPYFELIDKTKGMPSNNVYDIFQDKQGYLWFTTDEGLCRYNGATFKSYYSAEQSSRAGSSIGQDRYGRIWYSNFDGYLYYIANGTLHALKQNKPVGYLNYALTNRYLYIVGKTGVDVYSIDQLQYLRTISIADEEILFAYDLGEKYYILGKHLYEISDGKINRKINLPNNFYNSLGGKAGIFMHKTPKGLLFISKYVKNAILYKDQSFVNSPDLGQLTYVQNIATYDKGLWLCTPKGLYPWDMQPQSSKKLKPYFEQFNISTVYKDNNQNYWVGTLNKGVLLVQDFNNVLYELPAKPTVISSKLGKNKLTIATANDMLFRFDPASATLNLLYTGKSNHAINQLYVDSVSGTTMFTANKFNLLNTKGKVINEALVAVKDIKPIDQKYFSFAASGYAGFFYYK